jgi:hypothetical protein
MLVVSDPMDLCDTPRSRWIGRPVDLEGRDSLVSGNEKMPIKFSRNLTESRR